VRRVGILRVSSPPGLSSITERECRELLEASEIGRVIVSIDALPAAMPVSYLVVDDEIVFRSAPGTKLTAAVNQTVVGFQVDNIDYPARSGWSVLVVGRSEVVADAAHVAKLDSAGVPSWFAEPLPHYVSIRMQRISGRRLDSRPS
jgi:nitroimidazol reductase NimA-like FMN-containing flavoprotein (pyridoxamine 5'-phosphate oxidase superfamily)